MQSFSQLQGPAPPTSLDPSVPVLGSFDLNQHHYSVVLLAGATDAPIAPDSHHQFIEISRFKINGCQCAVVQVEPDLGAVPDLARLLTTRELQVATLVAMGRPNKQIASQLHISEWTVSTHLRRIFLKLGVDSRAAMVYRCAPMIQCQQLGPPSSNGP